MTEITLRRATPEDVDLYFGWVNDPEVRRQSFAQGAIAYEAHAEWFSRKVTCPDAHLFVLIDSACPVGQIRFDIDGDTAEIGYSIAREARGRGLSRHLVKMGVAAMAECGVKMFVAKVKPDNKSSIAVFLRCGFEEGQASGYRIFYMRPDH